MDIILSLALILVAATFLFLIEPGPFSFAVPAHRPWLWRRSRIPKKLYRLAL